MTTPEEKKIRMTVPDGAKHPDDDRRYDLFLLQKSPFFGVVNFSVLSTNPCLFHKEYTLY
jgi:hypothetical protein